MKNTIKTSVVLLAMFLNTSIVQAKEVLTFSPSEKDMTSVVRQAIENANDTDIKLVFEKGEYKFLPDFAKDKYCYITNHENGLKKIIFPFEGFNSVEIEGNHSDFIFHGQTLPFLFEECGKVDMNNVTIDWDIPFCFQGEVVAINKEEGWRDIKPATKGFSWEVRNGELRFPNIDGFHYAKVGSCLAFNPVTKDVAHGAWDMTSNPTRVEKRKNGILRFYENLKHYPEVGTVLNSKGLKGENRYAPAVHVISSKNIDLRGVIVHHALGMGFLMERSSDATISNCGVYVRKGSDRVVSSIADATHFCNCKGDIVVQDCRFESMLDDGTNVHGTYVEVNDIIDEYTVCYGFEHFQQFGFDFAEAGDEMWFIHQPDPSRSEVNEVSSVEVINDKYVNVRFKNKLPVKLKKGDILENKTWNPTFVMKGCTIQHHRARNIVIKTPKKIVIEDNKLSSMMSSILFRGETYYWYESGAVEDVLIRNNDFNYVAFSGSEHAVMYITPRLGKGFDKNIAYDRNIRFVDNNIETFDNRIVIADRVDGLLIKNNTIKKVASHKQLYPEAPLFDLIHCKNIEIVNNKYSGECVKDIVADKSSAASLKVKGNTGF